MRHHHIFSLALMISAVNGIVSPAVLIVAVFSWVWLPSFLLRSQGMIFFLSMLVTATATLLLSGVPAALYERASGDRDGRTTLWIWAAAALLLTGASLAWRLAYA